MVICDVCGDTPADPFDLARIESGFTPSVARFDLCALCSPVLVKKHWLGLSGRRKLGKSPREALRA